MRRAWFGMVAVVAGCGDNRRAMPNDAPSDPTSCTPMLETSATATTAIEPRWLTLLDGNADGALDAFYAGSDETTGELVLGVLVGRGDGTFDLEHVHATGLESDIVAFGDLDGDGLVDAVTAKRGHAIVHVHAGISIGQYAAPVEHTFDTVFWNPVTALAIVELHGSAAQHELLVAGGGGYATHAVLLAANGAALAKLDWPLTPVGESIELAHADLDGDGHQDVVALDAGAVRFGGGATWSAVTAVRLDAQGAVGAPSSIPCGAHPHDAALTTQHHFLQVARIDGDSYLDVLAVDPRGTACVMRGGADGSLTSLVSRANVDAAVAVDFAHDGTAELVLFAGSTRWFARVLVDSHGVAHLEESLPEQAPAVSRAVVGDLDRDGIDDIVVADLPSKQITPLRGSCVR